MNIVTKKKKKEFNKYVGKRYFVQRFRVKIRVNYQGNMKLTGNIKSKGTQTRRKRGIRKGFGSSRTLKNKRRRATPRKTAEENGESGPSILDGGQYDFALPHILYPDTEAVAVTGAAINLLKVVIGED